MISLDMLLRAFFSWQDGGVDAYHHFRLLQAMGKQTDLEQMIERFDAICTSRSHIWPAAALPTSLRSLDWIELVHVWWVFGRCTFVAMLLACSNPGLSLLLIMFETSCKASIQISPIITDEATV